MIYYPTVSMTKALMDMRAREAERKAAAIRLLEEAGIERRGGLSRHGYRLLYQLGHLLVTLGERMLRYRVPSTLTLESRVANGRSN
jgi:hypothetical protein